MFLKVAVFVLLWFCTAVIYFVKPQKRSWAEYMLTAVSAFVAFATTSLLFSGD